GVVGRAVDGEVEGDLHLEGVAGGHEAVEVGEGAEAGLDGVVTALLRADGVRAAGIAGRSHEAVVAALALGAADGMDGREVDDIEAEGRDLGQASLALGEGGAAAGHGALGAREHLVPGTETRARAFAAHGPISFGAL